MTRKSGRHAEFLAVFIVVTVLSGCSTMRKTPESARNEGITYIDPFSFGDEFSTDAGRVPDIPVSPDRTATPEASDSGAMQEANSQQYLTQPSADVYGYRIHLGVFNSREEADQMAVYAQSKLDVPVYMIYEPPFYRVRVGDFSTLKDATDYTNYMKNINRRFNNAYPLKSPINTQR